MKRKAEKESNTKKVNFEELIFKNISQPKMALDYSGYHFTYLDLSVEPILFRTRAWSPSRPSSRTTSASRPSMSLATS